MMTIDEMNGIRKKLGLTYQEICMRSGVPIGTVQKVLSGITKNPRMETMQLLEEALGGLKRGYERRQQETYRLGNSPRETDLVEEAGSVYDAYSGEMTGDTAVSKKKRVFTAAEREALPDDRRTELIDGVLYDMASPSMPHQDISRMICSQIADCIKLHHSNCHVYIAPADVYLDCDEFTVVQPDVFIVCDRKQITRKNIQGAPAFILEVLSPSTREKDKKIKLLKYLYAGVREYWMIDPDSRQVIVFDMTQNDKAVDEETGKNTDPYQLSIYGFSDQIPLAVSEGRCTIDMNPIRETLDELYPDA